MHKLFGNHTFIYEKDINYWDKIVKSKLHSEKPPYVFFSLTYLTPNYIAMFYLQKLSKLIEMGFKIVFVIWDMNSINYKPAKTSLGKFKFVVWCT